MKKNGFTLIELLAVIAIVGIIMFIAIPQIIDTYAASKKEAFKRNAQMVIETINNEKARDLVFDVTTLNNDNLDDILSLDNSNYDSFSAKMVGNEVSVHIVGKNSWSGIETYGTKTTVVANLLPSSYTIESCFTFSGNTITDYSISCSKNVVIPRRIGGELVTTVGPNAFSTKGLTSVVIPTSVTTIGDYAFYSNSLTAVDIPFTVTTIGIGAFQINYSLATLILKEGLVEIKEAAFRGINLWGTVTIPNSVTTIGNYAFYGGYFTALNLGSSLKTIGEFAFASGRIWDPVLIPNGVTTIGKAAFRANRITGVTIPNTVTSIGEMAFIRNRLPDNQAFIYGRNPDGSIDNTILICYGGLKDTGVVIPSTVVTIVKDAFNAGSLYSITIPSSVTTIGDTAFGWNYFSSITIPSSVNNIGFEAFRNNSLTSITFGKSGTILGDGFLLTGNNTFRTTYLAGGSGTYTGTQNGAWVKI